MRIKKIVAITMILLSLLLQISYAATTAIQGGINTENYNVHFKNINSEVSPNSEYVQLVINKVDGATIGVCVNNLYPGIHCMIDASLENSGNIDVEIVGLKLIPSDSNSNLYNYMVGFKSDNTKFKLDDYIGYLNDVYAGKILAIGQTLELSLNMGLDEEVTDSENTSLNYQILLNFKQSIEQNDNDKQDDSDKQDDRDKQDDSDKQNDRDKQDDSDKEQIEKKLIPRIEADIDDEKKSDIAMAAVSTDILPNTGGVFPVIVYVAGIFLMILGLILLKKQKNV